MKNQQERPNLFILFPQSFNRDAKYKYVEINYSPSFSEITQCMMETIPIFNNDRDPAQPGFIPSLINLCTFNIMINIRSNTKKYQELTSKIKCLQLLLLIQHFPNPKVSQNIVMFANNIMKIIQIILNRKHTKHNLQKSLHQKSCHRPKMLKKKSYRQSNSKNLLNFNLRK